MSDLHSVKGRIEEKARFWRDQQAEWSKSKKDPASLMVAAAARHRAEAFEEAAALITALLSKDTDHVE